MSWIGLLLSNKFSLEIKKKFIIKINMSKSRRHVLSTRHIYTFHE